MGYKSWLTKLLLVIFVLFVILTLSSLNSFRLKSKECQELGKEVLPVKYNEQGAVYDVQVEVSRNRWSLCLDGASNYYNTAYFYGMASLIFIFLILLSNKLDGLKQFKTK